MQRGFVDISSLIDRSEFVGKYIKFSCAMASRPLLLISALLLISIALVSSDDIQTGEEASSLVVKGSNRRLLPYVDCGALCKERCKLHSRQNVCSRACGTCCVRCKCVPPGTSGNREQCGSCYTDMTTHGNRTKCP